MLNKLLENKFRIAFAVLIICCFTVVRAFEKQLFYDPFLKYFEGDFKNLPVPDYNGFKLFLGILFRYLLNAFLSVALIEVLFRDKDITRFSIFLYLFFLVLLSVLFYLVLLFFPEKNWLLFYVRRFLIQPIFVLLFIPAFYYQQQDSKK
ncbi:exosortase F system-associated protein [Flavobacterium sp. Fl-77]|uniref:Exosortase F system-associated protein n=1 Tax=Flavobacterium flavipigmentatum TaxID=2893884 RepID=A0AAJ2SEB6_9FLAO|nr:MULTISPECIES: exosortase F system-associated protein [unclassified Flavobacterium]MDX6181335.1 exosortase F system-associated protein [Flavobacterium sp. Fl-33]MDX6184936.1 exosortase F system-associated protein [Flavobacterium sp. Fl-77]UFH40028.1 exosortase F system-associated protein [Flavobacterium sp. F-70]